MQTDVTSYATQAEANKTPERQVRRWLLELKLAKKRDKDWVKAARSVWDRYRGLKRKKNSFNILWANTDTLAPALYNSSPKPDVRRRFRDADPVGKAVSEVLERALSYSVDAEDFDSVAGDLVLDGLLPGRGVARIKYLPKTARQDVAGEESQSDEELVDEQVLPEHVNWEDFLHGPGRTWDEVTWVAFKCKPTKDDVEKQFGPEIAEALKYEEASDEDVNDKDNDDISGVFQVVTLWEVWDKTAEQVFFICESYKATPLYPLANPDGEPPLQLRGFFPTPKPMRFVSDSDSLEVRTLFSLYQEQADELDALSSRINRITRAIKLRGIYDSTMTEVANLMSGDDNDMIPATNAAEWITRGGIDKAVWFMPTDQAAKVLVELYRAREACKQTIFELTGISDILRGQTNPGETLGAQELKANYASGRLQKMQREVQRYLRDCIRIMAEVIADKFQPETLARITGLDFVLSPEQKQVLQQQAQLAQQQQQPPPPGLEDALKNPAWTEIMQVMRSDSLRDYRIDVETDSTIAAQVQGDLQALQGVLTGLTEFWNGVQAPVASGALPIEAVKSISLSVARRAKLGLEVEDALEKIQQPPPQPNEDEGAMKIEEAKLQQADQHKRLDMQAEQQKIGQEAQLEKMRLQFELQKAQIEADKEIKLAEIKRQGDMELARHNTEGTRKLERMKHTAEKYGQYSDDMSNEEGEVTEPLDLARTLNQGLQEVGAMQQQLLEATQSLLAAVQAPKQVVRGADGRVVGIQLVN